MKYFIFIIALFILGCDGESPTLNKGQPAPGFMLSNLQQKSIQFPDELRGKVVAIRFWADWCPFCKSEMQAIEPVYKKYREQGLVILAVNVRQDARTAENFIRKLNITYDVLLDETGEVARQYAVLGLPSTFFIDKEGRLATRLLGESTAETFEQIIKPLL